ncbi:hypothetical protein ACFQL4_15795 [Halosimplex aquaticum]
MSRRRTLARTVFAGLVLFAVALVGSGLLSWVVGDGADVTAAGAETVAPANGTTVITTSMQGNNRIVAYAPDGSVLYFNDSHGVYDDVDPSPRGRTRSRTSGQRS